MKELLTAVSMRLSVAGLMCLLATAAVRVSAGITPDGSTCVLVIDHSGSMKENDPRGVRLDAATLFVDALDDADAVSIVEFGNGATNSLPPTSLGSGGRQTVRSAIHGRPSVAADGTDIIAALASARSSLSSVSSGRTAYVVLLTDGHMEAYADAENKVPRYANETNAVDAELAWFLEREIPVQCIALSEQADTPFLRHIAAQAEGAFFPVKGPEQLLPVYLAIISSRRNLMRVESGDFEVLPGARELHLAVMGEDGGSKKSRIQSITVDGSPLNLQEPGLYWVAGQRPPPRFYDFLRASLPRSGRWVVSFARLKAAPQLHILQSAPLSLDILSPVRSKCAAGAETVFSVRLLSSDAASDQSFSAVLKATQCALKLQRPDGKEQTFVLAQDASDPALRSVSTVLKEEGDYLADFVAEIRPRGQTTPWTLSERRALKAERSPYSVIIEAPQRNAQLAAATSQPPARLRIVSEQGSDQAIPNDARVVWKTELRSGELTELLGSCWTSASATAESPLEGGQNRILYPGSYHLVVGATVDGYPARGAVCDFSIGLPASGVTGLATWVEGPGEAFAPHVEQCMNVGIDHGGRHVEGLDAIAGGWVVTGLTVQVAGPAGVTYKVMPISVAGGDPLVRDVCVSASETGTQTLTLTASLEMSYTLGGKVIGVRNEPSPKASLLLDIMKPDHLAFRPARVTFGQAIRWGSVATSEWVTVSNEGSHPQEVRARAKFQADGAGTVEIDTLRVRLVMEDGMEKPGQTFLLEPSGTKKLGVILDLTLEGSSDDAPGPRPAGRAEGRVDFHHAVVGDPSSSSNTTVGVEAVIHE